MMFVGQPRQEIDRVVSLLGDFSQYNRHLAEAGNERGPDSSGQPKAFSPRQNADPVAAGDGGGDEKRKSIGPGLIAEFIASLLEHDTELRLRKGLILIQIEGCDAPKPVCKSFALDECCLRAFLIALPSAAVFLGEASPAQPCVPDASRAGVHGKGRGLCESRQAHDCEPCADVVRAVRSPVCQMHPA
jgi:hypothetical protein